MAATHPAPPDALSVAVTAESSSSSAADPPPPPPLSPAPSPTPSALSAPATSATSDGARSPSPSPSPAHRPPSRAPLFDDHIPHQHVPGSLHLSPDSTISQLVSKIGYIPLIRQLAEDLAHRDRELVNFRRRAEERERCLRRMLQEAEVGNAEIERRLRECTRWRKRSMNSLRSRGEGDEGYTECIDEMLEEALGDEEAFVGIGAPTESIGDAESVNGVEIFTGRSSRRRSRVEGDDGESLNSVESRDKTCDGVSGTSSAGPTRKPGWKGLFWGQKQLSATDDREGEDASRDPRRAASTSNSSVRRKPVPPNMVSPTLRDSSMSRNASRSSLASTRSGATRSVSLQANSSARGAASLPYSIPDVTAQGSSASSVSNWALRMAAISSGGSALDAEPGMYTHPPPSPARPRSASIPDNAAGLDPHRRRPSVGTTENLQKLSARNAQRRAPAAVAGSAPTKSKFLQDIRDTAERIVPLGSGSKEQASSAATNDNGPVEMEMIIPQEAQPPTLLQANMGGVGRFYDNEHLTDRFGFIYDKRRESLGGVIKGSWGERRRDEEVVKMATSPRITSRPETPKESEEAVVDPKTPKRWQDLATVSTSGRNSSASSISSNSEPSSTTPLKNVKDSTTAPSASTSTTTNLMDRISRPSVSVVSTASVTTAFSEAPTTLRNPSTNPASTVPTSTAEEHTVRLLLGQLSDLHDSLQRDRTLKWNEFLRKIRAERNSHRPSASSSGHAIAEATPESLLADGELIGVATLGTEGRGGKQRWKEFRSLVLGGIPVAYRHKIWTECSGAREMKVPGYYEDLLAQNDDDPLVLSQISMDINRTLTDNVFFRKGPGVQKLRQVLVAYSRRNREVGYCQGMNMIAASLLLIMPTEEDAFWVLCSIVERILPKTYFEPNLLASRADQEVLQHYVAHLLPRLHQHLTYHGVELTALTFQWFLSIFTSTLPPETVFRVWDALLCVAGSTFLFQVAIALLKLNEPQLLRCNSAAEVYSYLSGGGGGLAAVGCDALVREADALRGVVRRGDVERRREKVVRRELREKGEREAVVRILVDEEKRNGRKKKKDEDAPGDGNDDAANTGLQESATAPDASDADVDPRRDTAGDSVPVEAASDAAAAAAAVDDDEDVTPKDTVEPLTISITDSPTEMKDADATAVVREVVA